MALMAPSEVTWPQLRAGRGAIGPIQTGSAPPCSGLLLPRVSQVLEKEVAGQGARNHSYLDLVRSPQLRKVTLLSGLFW